MTTQSLTYKPHYGAVTIDHDEPMRKHVAQSFLNGEVECFHTPGAAIFWLTLIGSRIDGEQHRFGLRGGGAHAVDR